VILNRCSWDVHRQVENLSYHANPKVNEQGRRFLTCPIIRYQSKRTGVGQVFNLSRLLTSTINSTLI
jgi:hypothetical protein